MTGQAFQDSRAAFFHNSKDIVQKKKKESSFVNVLKHKSGLQGKSEL